MLRFEGAITSFLIISPLEIFRSYRAPSITAFLSINIWLPNGAFESLPPDVQKVTTGTTGTNSCETNGDLSISLSEQLKGVSLSS